MITIRVLGDPWVDRVGKAADQALPEFAVDLGEGLGTLRDCRDGRIERPDELTAEAGHLLFVPGLRATRFGPRLRPERDRAGHRGCS